MTWSQVTSGGVGFVAVGRADVATAPKTPVDATTRRVRVSFCTIASATRSTWSYDSAVLNRPAACSRASASSASAARAASRSSFGLDLQLDLADRIGARRPRAAPAARVVSIFASSRVHRLGLLGRPFLVADLELRLRRRVAGVQDAHLSRLAAPLGMDDREDLAGRRQPPPRRRAPERVEEIERDEIEILVQRLERRDQLLVDADPEVGLAHPDFDVEVAMERLLVGQRPVVGDLHHVVVDPRQHLRLVVIPEPLGIGRDARVDRRLCR